MQGSSNNTLIGNFVNTNGTWGNGFEIWSSSNNTFDYNNIVSDNRNGISMLSSSYNIFTKNNITSFASENGYGIEFFSNSDYNTFIENIILSDNSGIYLRASFCSFDRWPYPFHVDAGFHVSDGAEGAAFTRGRLKPRIDGINERRRTAHWGPVPDDYADLIGAGHRCRHSCDCYFPIASYRHP